MGCQVGGVPRKKKKKVAQNLLKHALVLEFLKSDEIFSQWGGGGQKIKVVQNVLKHALVLEFLKSGKIFEKVYRHLTDRHYSENISRSA